MNHKQQIGCSSWIFKKNWPDFEDEAIQLNFLAVVSALVCLDGKELQFRLQILNRKNGQSQDRSAVETVAAFIQLAISS